MNMFRLFISSCMACSFVPVLSFAQSAEVSLHTSNTVEFDMADRIVATVNDRVITERDVGARIALTLRQLGLTEIPDGGQAQLIRRTLSELIDEEVKTSHAIGRGVQISDTQLLAAIQQIEQRNGMAAGDYIKLVEGLEREARKKLRAEVQWQQVIQRFVVPNVFVPEHEIDKLLDNLLKNQTQTEREIAQIFLPHSAERNEVETQLLIQKIQSELEIQDFASVARAYSEDEAARRGGNMGWFTTGETLPEIERILQDMSAGDVSQPVRTSTGWHIVQLLQVKSAELIDKNIATEYQIAEIILPNNDRKTVRRGTALLKKANTATTLANTLANLTDEGITLGQTDWKTLDAFSEPRQALLKTRNAKDIHNETRADGSVVLWKLLAVREQKSDEILAIRARIRDRLTQQRVQLEEQRLIRDLKTDYFVDIRVE